jgi:hypothetical protein
VGDWESDELYRRALYGDHPPACTCAKCARKRLGLDEVTEHRERLEYTEAQRCSKKHEKRMMLVLVIGGALVLSLALSAIALAVIGLTR